MCKMLLPHKYIPVQATLPFVAKAIYGKIADDMGWTYKLFDLD